MPPRKSEPRRSDVSNARFALVEETPQPAEPTPSIVSAEASQTPTERKEKEKDKEREKDNVTIEVRALTPMSLF